MTEIINQECSRITQNLNTINERIKQDEILRSRIGPSQSRIYRVLRRLLGQLLLTDTQGLDMRERNECVVSGMKLLRNTAAAFKTSVSDDELELCKFLAQVSKVLDQLEDSDFNREFQMITLQYFCNVIRGRHSSDPLLRKL